MTDISSINLKARDLMGNLTVAIGITGMRRAMWRARLGVWVIGLGVRITGMQGAVDIKGGDGASPRMDTLTRREGGRGYQPSAPYSGGGASPAMFHTDAPVPPKK